MRTRGLNVAHAWLFGQASRPPVQYLAHGGTGKSEPRARRWYSDSNCRRARGSGLEVPGALALVGQGLFVDRHAGYWPPAFASDMS